MLRATTTICRRSCFPRLAKELGSRGYRGYQLLRLNRDQEVEFMTMLWFESLEQVRSFAGENYEVPVISEKARSLLSHHADRADHYELAGSHSLGSSNS